MQRSSGRRLNWFKSQISNNSSKANTSAKNAEQGCGKENFGNSCGFPTRFSSRGDRTDAYRNRKRLFISMIFIDSNIPIYLVGTAHPHKVDAQPSVGMLKEPRIFFWVSVNFQHATPSMQQLWSVMESRPSIQKDTLPSPGCRRSCRSIPGSRIRCTARAAGWLQRE